MNKKYDCTIYDIRKKSETTKDLIDYMSIRTQTIFKWKNLPNNIPQRNLELMLQVNGSVFWMEHEGELCIYCGGLGGERDYLYRPTLCTIANPYQRFSGQFKIVWDKEQEGDGVIMLNDALAKGLMPMHRKYASLLSENSLSIWLSDILSRVPWLLSAQDDRTQKSAEQFLLNIFDAKLGVVTDSAFLDGIKEHALSTQQHMILSSLIQLNQYYKASWYNEIGLNAMQNGMKKEAISDSEEQMNQDILKPLIDQMLEQRKLAIEIVNEKFGTDISVELNSSWADNELEVKLEQQAIVDDQGNHTVEQETEDIETSENNEQAEKENAEQETPAVKENEEDTQEESSLETDVDQLVDKIVEDIVDEIKEEMDDETSN